MNKREGPSAWGASFWKDWQRCERYHFHRYAEGLELPDRKPTDEASLSGGTEFHAWKERWFKRELIEQPWPGELPKFPPDWKEFPIENARWLAAAYRMQYPTDAFDVEAVEQTFTVEPPTAGLLFPLSAKYDTIVRLRRNGRIASLEHKTTSRGMQFSKYRLDDQISQQIWVWNQLHPDDKMFCVIIDEANKAKNPQYRFRREELFRTGRALEDFLSRKIKHQEEYLDKCEKAVILEGQEIDPAEAFPQRTTQCHNFFGRSCPYLDLCEFGREAMPMYVKVGSLMEDDEENS